MKFPQVSDRNLWKVAKREDYWITLKSGDKQMVGIKVVYSALGKIGNKAERVLELNFFRKGAIIQMWFRNDEKPELVQSRIMKCGKWIFGPKGVPVDIDALVAEGEFVGVRVEMKNDSDKVERVDIFKPGTTASEILREFL
jgi:hypothetical protein